MSRDRLAQVRAQAQSQTNPPEDYHPRSPSINEEWTQNSANRPPLSRSATMSSVSSSGSHSRSGSGPFRRIASANASYDNLGYSPAAQHLENPFNDATAWHVPQTPPVAHTHDNPFTNPFESAAAGRPIPRKGHSYQDSSSSLSGPGKSYTPSVKSRIAQFDRDRHSTYSVGEVSPFSAPQANFTAPPPSSPFADPRPAFLTRRTSTLRPSFRHTQSFTREDLEAIMSPELSSSPEATPSSPPQQRRSSSPMQPMPPIASDDMDLFFEEISALQGTNRQLGDNITRIESLNSRLLNTLPETAEFERVSHDASRVTEDTRFMLNNLRDRIKNLERTNGRAASLADANIKRTQTASVKNRFIESIQRYSQVEASHRYASKQRLVKQYKIINPNASDAEVKVIVDKPESCEAMFRQAVLSSNRQGESRATLNAVQARHADILRIETTMVELAQLFQDMAMMVEEQNDAIVKIEESACKAEKDMESAHADLVIAKKSAMSARTKRKICFGILVLIILILAGVIAYVVLKNRSPSQASSAPPTTVVNEQISPVTVTVTEASVGQQPLSLNDPASATLESSTQDLLTSFRTPAAASSTHAAAVRSRASVLPRAMNFEERGRAWPMVNMVYNEDSIEDFERAMFL